MDAREIIDVLEGYIDRYCHTRHDGGLDECYMWFFDIDVFEAANTVGCGWLSVELSRLDPAELERLDALLMLDIYDLLVRLGSI